MKKTVFIALIVALMLPAVASAQLITTAQTITVKEKRVVEDGYKGYQQSIDMPIVTNFDDDGTTTIKSETTKPKMPKVAKKSFHPPLGQQQ
jgi:archaellin